MFLGVFREFRHSSPFVAQALPLPLCVIMGDELAAEPLPTHPLPNPIQIYLGDVFKALGP